MATATFVAYNAPKPTTAAPTPVTTGTAIKTLLQIATPSTKSPSVIEWGISFDGASGVPIRCELVQTDVAATVTAFASGDIVQYSAPNDEASLMTLGTTASGYTATSEGTTTATRLLDLQLVSPAGGFVHQFPLGEQPEVPVSKFLRVRVTAPVAVNAYCYVIWTE